MDREAPYRPLASPVRPRPPRRSDAVANQGTGWWASPIRVMALIALVGIVVSAAVSYTTWRIDRNNEHRLLQLQTRQAANLLSAAILGIQYPLQTALDVATAANGDPAQFTRFIGAYTGATATFAST